MDKGSKSGTSAGTIPEEFQSILKEIRFPISRNDLVDQARDKGISPEILQDLGMLPDKKYSSADEIMSAYEERVSKAAR